METEDPSLKPEQQAVEEMRVEPYASFMGYRHYLHIAVDANRVAVGDSLNIKAHIRSTTKQKNVEEQLTYAVSVTLGPFWDENDRNLIIDCIYDCFCRS